MIKVITIFLIIAQPFLLINIRSLDFKGFIYKLDKIKELNHIFKSVTEKTKYKFSINSQRNKTSQSKDNKQFHRILKQPNTYLSSILNPYYPIRNWTVKEPEITAVSAFISDTFGDKTLYKKNPNEVLPIASLTKLMTAVIVMENMNLNDIITISPELVNSYIDNNEFRLGEKISVGNLLYIMLIKSSNDAAITLAHSKNLPYQEFINLMNEKAKKLKMKNTYFTDPSGYDKNNISTVSDLYKLAKYILRKHPLIFKITSIKETLAYSEDKKISHYLNNTNKLLGKIPNILGGKTGYTDNARECMLLVIKKYDSELIFIILKSEDRLKEMKKLIDWINAAYKF
ncbi:D-alanyl-D-alanine carboxypeptidase [bacterium]|nr:D-alanyl-D-alanine carboxypeptidase [bacterium]